MILNDYKIIAINSFEEAKVYEKYFDILNDLKGNSVIEKMFNRYTNYGNNQLYFCFKKGFENLKFACSNMPTSSPLDEYAMSILCIIVDPYGDLLYSLTRYCVESYTMDINTISEIFGKDFYDVFKPNTNTVDAAEEALNKLRNGEDVHSIFHSVKPSGIDEMCIVELNNLYNVLVASDKTYLFKRWYPQLSMFSNGVAPVKLKDNTYNLINTNGELLLDDNFYEIQPFVDDIAICCIRPFQCNLINTKGEILLDKYARYIDGLKDGGFKVLTHKLVNFFVNSKGEILDNLV